jgi:DNA-binding transcriptional regulator YhcF (GntR family)
MLWRVDLGSPGGLAEQIAANVRRAAGEGELVDGERLPPAAELGRTLGVNANTVLVAYRQLRSEGLLEFGRGRGVRVRIGDMDRTAVIEAARQFHTVGQSHGYTSGELAALVANL